MKILVVLAIVLVTGCAANPGKVQISKDEKVIAAPIAAINVSQCDGSVALYVIIDPAHMVRFDQNQTTVFALDHDTVSETNGPPTPYKNALDLAKSASITNHVDVKCDGVST